MCILYQHRQGQQCREQVSFVTTCRLELSAATCAVRCTEELVIWKIIRSILSNQGEDLLFAIALSDFDAFPPCM